MKKTKKQKNFPPIVILGAGLAGLSAAYHLKQDYLLFEKESRPGGVCRTEQEKGFFFDYTGHFLHFKTTECRALVQKLLGRNLVSQERRSWVYSYKTYTRYPFQANTYGLPFKVIQECFEGLLEAHYGVGATAIGVRKPPHDFMAWILAAFGKGIAKHFMVPYNTKLWRTRPQDMTSDWMGRFIPQPSLEEFLKGALTEQDKGFGYNSMFWYPRRGGIEALSSVLAKTLDNLFLNSKVTRIYPKEKIVEINGEICVPYRKIISTLPLPYLVRVLDNAPAAVVRAAAGLRWTKVYNVNFGVDKPNPSDKHWVYFPEKKFIFYRVGFPSHVVAGMAPRGKSSINAEISADPNQPLSIPKLEQRVRKDLIAAGLLGARDRIVATKTLVIPCAYVIFDHQHHKNVGIIQKFLRDNQIYSVGRYGFWEYSTMEEAILAGKKTAQEITA